METKVIPIPNAAQQAAIDAIEGPVMLLAGPGTGKTFTLIKRVERMLETGIDPSSILCLTFSDAATGEMKSRLIEKLGTKAASVNVSTYHSFCMDIIRENPLDFEVTENVQMADDVTKQTILKESIDEFGNIEFLKDKWGNKYFYIQSIISGIETIKRERTTEVEYFDFLKNSPEWQIKLNELKLDLKEREQKGKPTKTVIGKIETLEKKIGKAVEFYSIYKIYKRKLNEANLIDFSDMINFVLDKMENDIDFLQRVTKNYKYILVDEYQDTSKVQNELIFNILKGADTRNIFVVGDDDQIIYSFQGARSSNLNDFLVQYPDAEIICLTENRRSTQTILDFAECVIDYDNFRLSKNPSLNISKKLTAKNEKIILKEQKIKLNIYTEIVQENNKITAEIENLIKGGVKPSEISILTRKNDQLENFARLLKQKSIPYSIQKQKNGFDVPAFIQFYFYLKLLVNSYLEQDKLFALLTSSPFKIEDKIIADILKTTRKEEKNFIEIIENISNSTPLNNFYKTFKDLKLKKNHAPLLPFLYEVLNKTGLLEFYSNSKDNRFENIQGIQRLIDEAYSYTILHKSALLDEFIHHLDVYFKENIKIELKKTNLKKEAVQLLTYHGSKGREFEYVFMPCLTSNMFEKSSGNRGELDLPIKKSVFSDDKELNKEAELLRLLFVGITRAKFGLYLSYSNMNEGKSQSSTVYLSRIFPECNNLVKQNIYELNEEDKINEIIKNLTVQIIDNNYKDEIKERISKLVISQTSLNKYINCPLQYFYSDILNVPVYIEDKDILEYGSSIHKAIDYMTKDAVKNLRWGDISLMEEKFIQNMNEGEFTSFDKRKELIERGKKAIKENYPKLTECNPENILSTEYKMELDFNGVKLKGFADRISKDNEGHIQIYDFKTGSYKNANLYENYYNQLRFYKFLYESLNPDKKVSETALIFFEESCKTSSPEPDITNNEEIKEKIENVIEGINSLNFEPKESIDNCKFCNYKLICKLHQNKN